MSSQVLVRRATVRGRTLALAIAGALTASMLAVTPASGQATFERLGSLELEGLAPEGNFAAVSDGTHAYYGARIPDSGLGSILKVKIDGLERVAAAEFPDTAGRFRTAAIHGEFLYFGTNGDPARIVKVNTGNLTSAGSVLLAAATDGVPAFKNTKSLVAAHIDAAGTFGYFGGTIDSTSAIVKVKLDDMTVVGFRELNLGNMRAGAFDATHGYFAVDGNKIVKVVLTNVTANNNGGVLNVSQSATTLDSAFGGVESAVLHGDHVYVGMRNGQIVKVAKDDLSVAAGTAGTLSLAAAETPLTILSLARVNSAGTHAYFGGSAGSSTGAVAKVDLDDFSLVSIASLCPNYAVVSGVVSGSELLVAARFSQSTGRITRLGVGTRVECPVEGSDSTNGTSGPTGGAVQGDPALDVPVAAAVAAAQEANVAGSSSAVLVRNGQVVPISSSSVAGVGPRGGVLLEAEGLKVSVAAAGGARPQSGVIAPVGGEIVCEVCAAFAAGSTIEAWMYSTPQLVAAVRVPDDHEDEDCVLLRIPVGAPLSGDPIEAGVHTLQLRLATTDGLQVLATGVTVGTPVPTGVPAGEGSLGTGLLGLFALLGLGGLFAAVRARGRQGMTVA